MATPSPDPGPAATGGPPPSRPGGPGPAGGAVTRRRELGQASARSLLLTVLGEFVLPADEPVWTRALLETMGALGIEAKSARQALARTAAEGLLVSDRDGRRVRWSLTTAGRRLLSEGAARIYGFGATATGWDGRWLVLLASVPESRRQLRHRLRTRLAWAGLGSPAPGVWVSPDPAKEEQVAQVLDELGLRGMSSSFVGRYGAIGRPADVVAQAWDLDRVELAYQEFLDCFTPAAGAPAPGAGVGTGVLARQVRLVHAWRRFPFLDPELPAELLPDRWAGARAADLFGTLHDRWDAPARAAWAELAGTP
ncbi:PaaX family transcriptional regulator [Pseudonocardia sp. HH130630-07]|uniref:PaaX family transcriptional regulator n=1 Tax=Pseudonocardia sp. HH130630-07 TaxID=1690815 RepID=UPI000814F59F|nr:PaaX family transcriptional regulator C-terminal domain-containing protein [Pseudonocardia sp. HH130630-07]ANY05075.1 PaaX family transcriptional regulator [Pseudonocardia sp. HH130630-07]